MMTNAVRLIAIACLLTCLASTEAMAEEKPSFVGIGATLFVDDGTLEGEEKISIQAPTDESYDHGSQGVLSISAWWLTPVWESLYVGAQLGYAFEYETSAEGQDDQTCSRNPQNDVCSMGHWIELLGRVEWAFNVLEELDVMGGAVFGLVLLAPAGDFEGEIDRLQDQGVDVLGSGVPRLGYVVGPVVATRWRFHERVALRGELGLKWAHTFLLNTEQVVSSVPFRKSWASKILRYELSVGIEAVF